MTLDVISTGFAPTLFGVLVAATIAAIWMAIAPSSAPRTVTDRLSGVMESPRGVEEELKSSLASRTILPIFYRVTGFIGGLLPQKNIDKLNTMLMQAGNPGGLSALDFVGLRFILSAGLGAGYFWMVGHNEDPFIAVRNTFIAVFAGFMLPKLWIGQRIKQRCQEITRALPDALDMLTIGVEAGLAFDSALLRVGEQWNNALTQEFRRVVSELRIGVSRNEALRHMAERNSVDDLSTFVAVLIQSNMLGMSIAQVLHSQADQMRLRRRQLAEEQAHGATVKIVVVLVLFIFPALFIVILGPVVPKIMQSLQGMAG